jgi:hypothetical protein
MKSSRRQLAGVFLLVSLALLSSLSLARRARRIHRDRFGQDETTLYLRRFEPLRKALPAHATVGYEADSEDPLTDRQEVRRFYLAQYALAPAILVAGSEPALVVGNYRDPARCRVCAAPDFVLVSDFGDGLMLFRRSSR